MSESYNLNIPSSLYERARLAAEDAKADSPEGVMLQVLDEALPQDGEQRTSHPYIVRVEGCVEVGRLSGARAFRCV